MSANVAYGQVSITDTTSYTEDIDMTNADRTVGEDRPHPVYEDINYSELVDWTYNHVVTYLDGLSVCLDYFC